MEQGKAEVLSCWCALSPRPSPSIEGELFQGHRRPAGTKPLASPGAAAPLQEAEGAGDVAWRTTGPTTAELGEDLEEPSEQGRARKAGLPRTCADFRAGGRSFGDGDGDTVSLQM